MPQKISPAEIAAVNRKKEIAQKTASAQPVPEGDLGLLLHLITSMGRRMMAGAPATTTAPNAESLLQQPLSEADILEILRRRGLAQLVPSHGGTK